MSVVPQDPASGYAKELPAGQIECPTCKRVVQMVVAVKLRRQFGTPMLDEKKTGVCLVCDLELEEKIPISESSSSKIHPE